MATLNFTKDPTQVINGAHLAAVIDATLEWTDTEVTVGIAPDLVIVTNAVLEETDILRSMVQSLIDGYVVDPTFTVIDGVPSVARPRAEVVAEVAALPPQDREALFDAMAADYLARTEQAGVTVPVTTRAPVVAPEGGGGVMPPLMP